MSKPIEPDGIFVDYGTAPFQLVVSQSCMCRLCGAWLLGPHDGFDPQEVHRKWHEQQEAR